MFAWQYFSDLKCIYHLRKKKVRPPIPTKNLRLLHERLRIARKRKLNFRKPEHMRLLILLLFTTAIAYSQNLKSGGKLKPEQAIMDIRHYTIALDVDPQQKFI